MNMTVDPLHIGHIIGVEGDTVDVQIGVEDLRLEWNEKVYRVGRLGTYITIPLDDRILIGYVTRVGYAGELSPRPNPSAPRCITMTAQLLGTVHEGHFSRGVNLYPTLGDAVKLGVDRDFETIFGTFERLEGQTGSKSFPLGRFSIDTDFEVRVLGKEFFAKHVAVMGNSGSGKSCTTAKIVHEAMSLPYSQIVMFDMHGEYLRAFSDEHGRPLPNVTYLSDRNLVLPYWLLAYEELEQLFVDPNNPTDANAQKLFLRQALERLKAQAAEELRLGPEFTIDTPIFYSVEQLMIYATNMNAARFVLNTPNYAFSRLPFRQLPPAEQEQLLLTRRMEFNPASAEGEVPHATFAGRLLGLMNTLESRLNDRRYDFLLRPFEQAKRNADLADRFSAESSPGAASHATGDVIRQLLGQLTQRRNLTIIDLSGLPFDVVDITVAVLTRALFDFNFWSPVDVRQPVLLVYEEAHNYLPRKPQSGRKTFARNAVEKVAKEGRKYGVAAMVVSQRPSEISETVLSQCNSMVLMRMNNPDDQEYAGRVVSDQFRSLINLLPSLKPGEGFVIGDAVLMPMRTNIDMPPREPQSANMDFFGLWSSGGRHCDVDAIVNRWWRQERVVHVPATNPAAQPEQPPSHPQRKRLFHAAQPNSGVQDAAAPSATPPPAAKPPQPAPAPQPDRSAPPPQSATPPQPAAAPTDAKRLLEQLAQRFAPSNSGADR